MLACLLLSAGVVGVKFKGKNTKGRTVGQLPATAKARQLGTYYESTLRVNTAYGRSKRVYYCHCDNSKHLCIRADGTISRNDESLASLSCRVCTARGSNHEQMVYDLLDACASVHEYATEVHAVQGTIDFEGVQLNLGRHRWDILVMQPAHMLIAVQGEQHNSKPDTRENSISADLAESLARDHALAAGAMQQGFHVVWLSPGNDRGRKRRWLNTITTALQQAKAGMKAKLHKG